MFRSKIISNRSRIARTPLGKYLTVILIIFVLQSNLLEQGDNISEAKPDTLYLKYIHPCTMQQISRSSFQQYQRDLEIKSEYRILCSNLSVNFQARYKFGNIQKNKKGLKNFHLNIRSLSNKISEVKCIIKQNSPHIFGLSECELRKVNQVFDERTLKIPGYDLLFPSSWQVHGYARVVIYVKSSLHYTQVHDLQDDTVQSIWIKGGFKNSKKMYFCHAYREHTSTMGSSISSQKQYLVSFLQQWENASTHDTTDDTNEIHVVGDMNLDALEGKWLRPGYHLVSLSRLVESACNVCNLTQIVHKPTRYQFNSITGKTDISCIDHAYTNAKFRCSDVVVSSFGGSDHDLISYTRYSKEPPNPAKTIRRRSYKNFVAHDFQTDLREVDWTDVYSCMDLDQATDILTTKFRDVLDKHAPWIVYQERKHYAPWLTEETLKLMKERDDLKASALKLVVEGQDAAETWNKFRKIRNKVNNRRKFEENNFKSKKLQENMDSPINTWKTAKSFMNWSDSAGPPCQLSIAGRLVTKASKVASEMNSFFMNKVKLIRDSIQHIPNTFSRCSEIMENKQCRLSMKHINVNKVNKILKGLKNSKSSSVDGLDNFCVKLAADFIDKPLHPIINLSILQSKFPTGWKISKVIPLHKKGSKLEMKNYRPVTILSPLSKVLEKIVYEQVYDHFSRNKIFHPSLHGYRQYRSTQTALLSMYDRWVRAAADGKVTGVILLDLSAAFDLVEPAILVEKLRIYGMEEDFLCWVQSYLTNRQQAVWINHVLFSQSVSLTQYVVLCVHLFQLASESSRNVVARRRSDYCPRGAIFILSMQDINYLFETISPKKYLIFSALSYQNMTAYGLGTPIL